MANPNMIVGGPPVNPKGRPAGVFSTFSDTADRLLQKYTVEQIIALAGDPQKMSAELTSFQAVVLIQLANTLSARGDGDMALERERLLDRTIGKAIQRTEQKIMLSVEIESELLAGRRRVSQSRGGDSADVIEGNYLLPIGAGTPDDDGAMVLRVPDAILRDAPCPAPALKAKPAKVKKPSFNDRLAAAEAARLAAGLDKQ